MRISIAMCSYNGERFIDAQLQSLLEQQRKPDQIIVCDDCSSDGTRRILQRFRDQAAEHGVEVELQFNESNLGYVRNFEKALLLCNGDLVFLCDQDDVWHPGKLARYVERFEGDPGLLALHSDARLVDGKGRDLGCGLLDAFEVTRDERNAMHRGNGFSVLLRRNIVTGATMAFRRELVAMALPVNAGWIHDEWLAMVAASQGGHIDCMEWESIDYRQHEGNQIGASRRSLKQKLQGVGMPRREFLAKVVMRMESLLERSTQSAWLGAGEREELQRRIAHGRIRAGISPGSGRRWGAILAEIRNLNYWRYSTGVRSIVADMLALQ